MKPITLHFADKRMASGAPQIEVDITAPDNLLRAQFHVTGMSCASCVNKVERHLKKKNGTYTVCAQCSGLAHMQCIVCVVYTMCGGRPGNRTVHTCTVYLHLVYSD